jgi:hypothetical protein
MPGSFFYALNLLQEEVLRFWYFGDFGSFHYNLKQSDKYLVEAKTLLEYKQYLLGYKALLKSDFYFEKVYPSVVSAKKNGKNILEKQQLFRNAQEKHIEELVKLKKIVPQTFDWIPEEGEAMELKLWGILDRSIRIREKT